MQAMSEGVQVWPEFEELQVVREEMQVTSVFNSPPVLVQSRTVQPVTLSVSDVWF